MKVKNESKIIARLIQTWLRDYVPSVKGSGYNTRRSYENALSSYATFIEQVLNLCPYNIDFQCFSRSNIELWIKWMKETRLNSSETCNNRLAGLRSFLQYASNKEVSMSSLYVDSIAIPRQKSSKKKVCGMTKNAIKELMSAINTNTRKGLRELTIISFLYDTAARISEALSIHVNDLHFDAQSPYVIITGKRRKTRTLYITKHVVSYLKSYIAEFHDNNFSSKNILFYSRNLGRQKATSPESVNKILKKYASIAHEKCVEVPLNIHCHMLRHAKATHWLEDGLNILQVSVLLGHANLNVTMIYLDISLDLESKALSTMEDEEQKKLAPKWKGKKHTIAEVWGIKGIK